MYELKACQFGINAVLGKDLRLRTTCDNPGSPDKSVAEADILLRPIQVCSAQGLEEQQQCSGCQLKTFRVPDLNRSWV
jgi:hypothetical protein